MADPVPLQNLPKHDRYRNAYQRFGFYWGLGVEHETYLMTSRTKTVKTFIGAMRPERYCVSYYEAYKPEVLKKALGDVVAKGPLTVPILMNCHSLTKCDVNGEHETTYERVPKPTPKFTGKTLFEWMCQQSEWFRTEVNKTFMWDGDTIEFMTQRFYKATIDQVMEELQEGEARFVQELGKLNKGVLTTYGPLRLASPRNEPFATFVTNPYHVSMFNNGTIHINVTLPTRLGWNKKPLWRNDFVEKHRRLARLVQWLEPLWIAVHGSGDPLTSSNQKGFAAGSQRLAVSRYIGVGTFNTDTMPVGKILQVYKAALGPNAHPWYKSDTAYEPLEVIGLDINFNKHWAHGLELRFLDQLPMESLRSVMGQVVILMDLALEGFAVPDPRKDPSWIAAASAAIYRGPLWEVAPIEINAICAALRIGEHQKAPMSPAAALMWLFTQLEPRHAFCWKNIIGPINVVNRCFSL